MKTGAIAIIAWGSLIWRPKALPLSDGQWYEGGPTLPIEFSRVSGHCNLTLVIDTEDGVPVPTRFAVSAREHLREAGEDLQRRERTVTKWIGWADAGTNAASQHTCAAVILEWVQKNGLAGGVWTALLPNFPDKLEAPFTLDRAEQHLRGLDPRRQQYARHYINCAPSEVETKLRRRLRERGWL